VDAPAETSQKPAYFTLAYAARKLFPVPHSPATVTRYVVKGLRKPDGSVRKLPGLFSAGRWWVTKEDVEAFVAAITADRSGRAAATPARREAAARAESACAKLGL
jgi:hypothetical protein